MRMRKKKNLESRINSCSDVLIGWLLDYDKTRHENNILGKIDFFSLFGNHNPVILELGCGKGTFINQLALKKPNYNYIAIEKNSNVIISAMENTKSNNIKNIKYIIGHGEYLENIFEKYSFKRIFLNFSCPYPKSTYAKRRLTHKRFLDMYKSILSPNGDIRLKTDNKNFFEFSKESLLENNFTIKNISLDLHNSNVTGNIITEYEYLFSKKGFPIYYLEACPNNKTEICQIL